MNALVCTCGQLDDVLQHLRGVGQDKTGELIWYLCSSILIRRLNRESLGEQVTGNHNRMNGRWAFTGRKDGTPGVHLAQGVDEKFGNLSRAKRVGMLDN